MSKILKVGFAMGGGVSLGTFSGAALSESIKQLILYGKYKDSNGQLVPYDKIVIDVFSGASAGMMSLAIMLRGLTDQSNTEQAAAVVRLEEELTKAFVDNLRATDHDRYQQLVVAQVVQNLQDSIWIDQINIDNLLGLFEDKIADLTYEPGLLAREALTRIAKNNFKFQESSLALFPRRQILADRVLVAATLSNLTPIKCDERDPNDAAYVALGDAKTSYVHREMRVFDLNFTPLQPGEIDDDPGNYPRKWIRYHMGEKTDHYFGDIRHKNAWSKIVATGIACGAFPFAFEPVVLVRHDFEYGAGKDEQGKFTPGDWPTELKGKNCYSFTYVDGGTFNNEPVREAYRLASFQDAGEKEEFDRVIIFVDPNVGEDAANFRVPIHKEFHQRGDHLPKRSTTADRLMGQPGTLLGSIINQSKVNESDKIHRALEMFDHAEKYYGSLLQLIDTTSPDPKMLGDLKKSCEEILSSIRLNELLPPGAVTLSEELGRINRTFTEKVEKNDIDLLVKGSLEAISPIGKKRLVKAMLMLLVDLMMGLGGKVKDSKTVGIAPVKPDGDGFKSVFLPGGYFASFAGFTSKHPNLYEAKLAKYCAQIALKKSELIGGPITKEFFYEDFSKKGYEDFESDFIKKLPAIATRIGKILTNALSIDGLAEDIIINQLSKRVSAALRDFKFVNKKKTTYLLQIPVSESNYQINRNTGNEDLGSIETPELGHVLMIELDFVTEEGQSGKWAGDYVTDGKLKIVRDRKGPLNDHDLCVVQLPLAPVRAEADLSPNPVLRLVGIITSASEGKTYNKWEVVKPDVIPLEEILL